MIKIKNFTIFKCDINKSFHWSKLSKLLKLMYDSCFDLSFANLSSADLSFANLSSADLRFADLSFADLSFADLSFANLSSANLSSAKLKQINNNDVIIEDFISVVGLGSRNRTTLIFKTNQGIVIRCGCFYGLEKDFKKKVKETHQGSNFEKEYLEMLKLAKIRFKRGDNGK